MEQKTFPWRPRQNIYPPELWRCTDFSRCKAGIRSATPSVNAGWSGWAITCTQGHARYTDYYSCIYCGESANEVDHLIPINKGGAAIVPACRPCVRAKGDQMPVTEWHVGREVLIHVSKEVSRIIDSLQGVAHLATAEATPSVVRTSIADDTAWLQAYLAIVEKREERGPL